MKGAVDPAFFLEMQDHAQRALELRNDSNPKRRREGLGKARDFLEDMVKGIAKNRSIYLDRSVTMHDHREMLVQQGIIDELTSNYCKELWSVSSAAKHTGPMRDDAIARGWAAFDSLLLLFEVFPTKTTTPSPTPSAPIKFELKAEIGAVKSPSAAGTTWAQSRQSAAPTPPKPTKAAPITANAPSPFIIVLCLAIVILAAGAAYNSSTPKSEPVDQSAVLTDNGMLVGFVATQNVNVRDRPTAKGSILFGTLPRGTQFGGVSVSGVEQTTKWVRVGLDGGTRIGYIWAGSLQRIDSAVPPRAQTEAKQLPKEDVQSAILRDDETARQHASQSNNAKPVSAPQTALSVTCILPSQRGKPPEVAQTSRVDCIARSGIID